MQAWNAGVSDSGHWSPCSAGGDSETAQLSCTVYKFQTVISVLLFGLPGFMVNFVLVSQCLSVPWQDSVVVKIKDC